MQTRTLEDQRLDFLLGDWKASGVVHPGRFGPGGKSYGQSRYQWELSGKWLTYTSRLQLPALGNYEVSSGVSYDPSSKIYKAFAINSFGILLVYEGRWTSQKELVFDLTHPIGREKSRVVYVKCDDNSFEFRSETSADGQNYEAYFETTHTKV